MLFDDKTDKFLLPITNKKIRIKDHTESKKIKVLQVKCNDKLRPFCLMEYHNLSPFEHFKGIDKIYNLG